jgi:hypothetical protein
MLIEIFRNMNHREIVLTLLMNNIISLRTLKHHTHERETISNELINCMPATDLEPEDWEYITKQLSLYVCHKNVIEIVEAYIKYCHIDIPGWGLTEMIKKEFNIS